MAAAMLASRAGADSGDTETATQPLLPHMLSQDELQLFKAADKGDFLQVDRSMRAGARADKARPTDGWTAAGRAAWNGRSGVIQIMLDYGVSPNLSANQTSLLHVAAERSKLVVVRKLLLNGADPNVKDAMGRTPFMLSKDETVRDLLAGAMMSGASNTYKQLEDTPTYEEDEQVLCLTKDAQNNDGWFPAVVKGSQPGAVRVHFPMWSSRFDLTVRPESLVKVSKENLEKCRQHLGVEEEEVLSNKTSSKQSLSYIGRAPPKTSAAATKSPLATNRPKAAGKKKDGTASAAPVDKAEGAADSRDAAEPGTKRAAAAAGGTTSANGSERGGDDDDEDDGPPSKRPRRAGSKRGSVSSATADTRQASRDYAAMQRESAAKGAGGKRASAAGGGAAAAAALSTSSEVASLLDTLRASFASKEQEVVRLNAVSDQLASEHAAKDMELEETKNQLQNSQTLLAKKTREMVELQRELAEARREAEEWKGKALHFQGVNDVLHKTILEGQDRQQEPEPATAGAAAAPAAPPATSAPAPAAAAPALAVPSQPRAVTPPPPMPEDGVASSSAAAAAAAAAVLAAEDQQKAAAGGADASASAPAIAINGNPLPGSMDEGI